MMKKIRLAIITTHPIQYNAPLFRQMSEANTCFIIKVFYTWSQAQDGIFDKEFGLTVKWDIPLLDGYDYKFVSNTSSNPGSHSFTGIVNPSLKEEIKAWKADAILVYGWAFSSHLKAILYFHHKIPVLFRGDSTLLDESTGFSVKKLLRKLFLRWVYRHIDYALYVGSANKKYFSANGLQPKQLLFAPHAIDNYRFTQHSEEYDLKATKWREDLGIPVTNVIILYAAKLSRKKDPEILIKAFLTLVSDATLLLAGNGEMESELKEKYATSPGIIFIDFQNQSYMPILYRMGDIFVLPSKGPGETWGLAINEAMACSRAVIASDKCGSSYDLIHNGKNGYVFESGNQHRLESCLKEGIKNFEKMGLHSKKIIKEWSYTKIIEQLHSLLEPYLRDE